jgi:hypothetical protein
LKLWERLLIRYSIAPALKSSAYLLALLLVVSWLQSKASLLLLALPLLADLAGGLRVRARHPEFLDALGEKLKAEALRSCAIDAGEPHYDILDAAGSVRHWLLKDLADSLTLTTMAPKPDFLTIAKKTGRAFPPRSLDPLVFDVEDAGTVEAYYANVNAIEIRDNVVSINISGAAPIEYEDHTGAAIEAVSALRARLREYKARQTRTVQG